MDKNDKNIVLFINAIRPATFAALDDFERQSGRKLVPVVFIDETIQVAITERNVQKHTGQDYDIISADFDSPMSVRTALNKYKDRILAVTSQYENSIHELRKLVPYLPYIHMPTQSSLEWATEKKLMRQLLEVHDGSLVPKYLEIKDYSEMTINEIENHMNYPLVVKPSGLEGSLLVSLVSNREELVSTLDHTSKEIQKGYDTWIKRQKPVILVEEFMDGEMYSVDTYISSNGTCYHTPLVRVLTGRSVGFDDFFGYVRLAPSGLDDEEESHARQTAEEACHALGLRSKTAHVELMRTKDGWKIIELGPRIGGYRHDIYRMTYGINHIVNDILIRADEIPVIPTEVIGNTAIFNIYAKSEGILDSIEGEDMVRELDSFVSIKQSLHVNDELFFARNNGDPVFEIILHHVDGDQLARDINKMEEALVINVR